MLLTSAVLASLSLTAAPTPPEFSQKAADAIIGGALTDGQTLARVTELTDRIGPRLSGSPGAEAAVKWALARFKAEGVSAHLEPVTAPHWVRGVEKAELLVDRDPVTSHTLTVTALGGSSPTPDAGVTAGVIEVRSIDALKALGDKVRGQIVFFNHDMAEAEDYRKFGVLRFKGPPEAAKLGAVGAVVRSLATAAYRLPHTGATSFEPGQVPIPAASLAVDDSEILHRALQRGPVKLHLTLGCETLPPVASANVVAEVRGREHPEEIVVLGAHLDSWDLAVGAQDDGTGVAIVMEAAKLISDLRPAPRRTMRFVLFMNEENGLAGGKAYAATHAKEVPHHVAAMETDVGSGRPLGVTLHAGPGGEAIFRTWAVPLTTMGAAELKEGEAGGADVSPLAAAQVPMIGVHQDASRYFDIHHTAADTMAQVKPFELAQNAAAYAWLAYAAAESKSVLPRPSPKAATPASAPSHPESAPKTQ